MARFSRIACIFALCIVLVNCPSAPKPPVSTVAAPSFSPSEGTYRSPQTVTIATSTEGAEIRYTTDGSEPTATTGTVYAGPLQISATTTVRAIATRKGWSDSAVTSATFTIQEKVAEVSFDPPAGSYEASARVTLQTATAEAQIYYTTDGSTPSVSAGTLYSEPISVTSSQTITAIAVRPSMADSEVTSAQYTITAPKVVTPEVPPVTDQEIMDARNALARAREVEADYYDPDNYDAARRLLEDGVSLKTSDPAAAHQKLADSKEKADLAFDNSVKKSAAVMAANLEAARKRLLSMEADKFLPDDYQKSTAGIEESASLFQAQDYAGARARAYQALKEMTDLANRLQTRLASVRQLKFETEQLMKQAESEELYRYAPEQRDKVLALYTRGVDSFQGYRLDDAEESFGAAREAARDTIRIAREARDASQAEQRKKAEAMQEQVMKSLVEASSLTVVTEDGTVVKPQNWTEDDFLKEIDRLQQQQQEQKPGGQSLVIPNDPATVVLADDNSLNLLQQARDLWTQGLREKQAGNYGKAMEYFAEAQRYLQIYRSYAVKGVYTVRLIPERRDCLWRIAEYKDIYGDPYQWPNIWRRNRKLIQNPDLIYPGWQLVIPLQ